MNMRIIKKSVIFISVIIFIYILIVLSVPSVYADTDGSELKITDQPDKFILELGTDWAGAKFELKLDTGIFPVPVEVDESGVLAMELGGSKTYTLTLLTLPEVSDDFMQSEEPSEDPEQTEPVNNIEDETLEKGIPPLHLVLFIGVLVTGITVLVVMHLMKRSREHYSDDEYESDSEDS